jgi:hypothetical protein
VLWASERAIEMLLHYADGTERRLPLALRTDGVTVIRP